MESTTKAGLRYKPSAYGKAALEGEVEHIEQAPDFRIGKFFVRETGEQRQLPPT